MCRIHQIKILILVNCESKKTLLPCAAEVTLILQHTAGLIIIGLV